MSQAFITEDFSERLHPMLVRELRQALRARTYLTFFVAIQAAMIVASLWDLVSGEGNRDGLPAYFWGVLGLFLVLVLPLSRFRDIQRELNGRNAELLLLSGVSRWRIVIGKWLASMTVGGLATISVLPYLMLAYFRGGFEVLPNVLMLLAMLVTCAVYCALVIGVSAYRNYLGRIILLIMLGAICYVSVVVPGLVMMTSSFARGTGKLAIPLGAIATANTIAMGLLQSVLGLQLARVKLRTFEDPFDPAPGGQVIWLFLFSPILVAVPALITFGLGGIVTSLFFTWVAYSIDPPPKKNRRALWAQS